MKNLIVCFFQLKKQTNKKHYVYVLALAALLSPQKVSGGGSKLSVSFGYSFTWFHEVHNNANMAVTAAI